MKHVGGTGRLISSENEEKEEQEGGIPNAAVAKAVASANADSGTACRTIVLNLDLTTIFTACLSSPPAVRFGYGSFGSFFLGVH